MGQATSDSAPRVSPSLKERIPQPVLTIPISDNTKVWIFIDITKYYDKRTVRK